LSQLRVDNGNVSSVALAIGIPLAVLVVGVGVYICQRRGGQRQNLLPLPPQVTTIAMYANPMHLGIAGPATKYEEPAMLHLPESAHVEVDSELYVTDQRTSTAEASYAVFGDVHPGADVSVHREAGWGTYATPIEGGLFAAPNYMEVSGGAAADAEGTYAVFQSTGMDATA
jgi:hypothetical protein